MDAELFDTVLICLAATSAAWTLGPFILSGFGLGWVHFNVSEDPADAVLRPGDEIGRQRFEQLQALGFEPVGAVTESAWLLYKIHWVKRITVRCLAMRDGKCFAALYRLTPYEPVRVSLTTITTDRGMVQTAMPGVGNEHHDERMLRL